jgi:hypothetical protein
MGIYRLGQSVKLHVAFTDSAGAAANPTTVTCKVEKPDGTETTYTSVSTPAITNPTTGTFELIISASQAGGWTYRWDGVTGPATPVDEEQFQVLGSAF